MDETVEKVMYSNDDLIHWGEIPSPMLPTGFIEEFEETIEWIWLQYTGLKDKNGKEIYEGDIIRHDLRKIAEVKFGEGTNLGGGDSSAYFYGYYLEFQNYKDTWGNNEVDSGSFRETKEIEVIGNIYETPELLKEVK